MLFCFWFTVALFHVITVVFFLTSTLILKGHFVLIRCGALLRQPSDEPFSLKPLQEEQKWHGVKSISFTEWQQQPYLRNYAFHFFSLFNCSSGMFSSGNLSLWHMEKSTICSKSLRLLLTSVGNP